MRIRIQKVSQSADLDPDQYCFLTSRLNILFIIILYGYSAAPARTTRTVFPRNNCLVVAGIYWLFQRGTYRARVPSGSAQWAIIGGVWCGILRQFGGGGGWGGYLAQEELSLGPVINFLPPPLLTPPPCCRRTPSRLEKSPKFFIVSLHRVGPCQRAASKHQLFFSETKRSKIDELENESPFLPKGIQQQKMRSFVEKEITESIFQS